MSQPPSADCLIVGAGLSGLTAARCLHQAGLTVMVLDKGRGVGGRLATRWRQTSSPSSAGPDPDGPYPDRRAIWDHGAQYFTVRDPQFAEVVQSWQAAGVVAPWADGFARVSPGGDATEIAPDTVSAGSLDSPGNPSATGAVSTAGHRRYRGVGGLNAVAKAAAEGLPVQLNCAVTALSARDGLWHVSTASGAVLTAPALVMTPPVPQSLALLNAADGFALDTTTRQTLETVRYAPCLAVLVELDSPAHLPAPGGLFGPGEPWAWMADNTAKGISPDVPTLTIHAGIEYSTRHYEHPQGEVVEHLVAAARPHWHAAATVVAATLHRWRYSLPLVTVPQRCWIIGGTAGGHPLMAFAGDAFGGPRVEGAYLSGLAAGQALAERLAVAGSRIPPTRTNVTFPSPPAGGPGHPPIPRP